MPLFKKIGAVQHPMNLVYLATWLESRGHSAEIIDLEVEREAHFQERLTQSPPLLVGITVMTPNMPEAQRLTALCRHSGIRTVLGGVHPTLLPLETLRETGCDYVVAGEGEKPLLGLLQAIKHNQSAHDVQGLAFMQDGAGVVNPRPELMDINKLPLPNRRLLRLDLYTGSTTPGISAKAAVLFTSRGCPYDCNFCASKAVNRRRVRFRNMAQVFKEVDDIVALGFEHLTIEDDTFTLNRQRVAEFCSYLKSNHPSLSWDCDSRADAIDEDLLKIMQESRCRKIAFGVESGSERVLKSIQKNLTPAQVCRAFRLTRKFKILTQAFFMLGFPDETLADVRATEKLIAQIAPDFLFLSIAVPYPGTALYDELREKNYLTGIEWKDFVFFGETVPWRTEHFYGEQLVKMRKSINRRFYFNPRYIGRKIMSVRRPLELCYLVKGGLVALGAFFDLRKGKKADS